MIGNNKTVSLILAQQMSAKNDLKRNEIQLSCITLKTVAFIWKMEESYFWKGCYKNYGFYSWATFGWWDTGQLEISNPYNSAPYKRNDWSSPLGQVKL